MNTKEKKTKIIPRNNSILVRVDDAESRTTSSGVIVPDEVEQKRKAQGTVEAVGPKVEGVKKGDRVIYGAYAGEEVMLRDGAKQIDYRILDDSDVIAFIEK